MPIILPEFDIRRATLRLEGTAPLISHRWSEKAKAMMLEKQMKKATTGKEAKDPQKDFEESIYWIPAEDGDKRRPGFPAVAFKAAAVRAGTYADQKMTFLRGAFHIAGELIPIEGEPEMREDMVRIAAGTADIRYRAQFMPWSAELPITFNARAITDEQLVNLFRIAGFAVGIGEWRPERDGSYGTFQVA